MKHNRWKGFRKVTALMLTAAVAVTTIDSSCYMTAEAEGNTENSGEVTTGTTISQDYSTERLTSNYTHVSSGYSAAKYTGQDISYAMEDVITKKEQLTEDNYDYHGKVADISHGDEISLTLEVKETGLYWVGFDYLSYDESILPIELSFRVDGEYPFYEC